MAHVVKLAVLTWKEGEVYVADSPAVQIASQGDTEQEALDNLKEAIELYFEDSAAPELPPCQVVHACELEVSLAT